MQQILQHHEVRRAVRFGIVGVVNTIIDFALFSLLHYVFGIGYLIANLLAFLTASVNSYLLNRRWTFRSSAVDVHREFVQYILVIGVGFLLNEGALYFLVSRFGWAPIIAKIGATVLSLSWNFTANRLWTFKTEVQGQLADRP